MNALHRITALFHRNKSVSAKPNSKRQLRFESLEERQLLSVTPLGWFPEMECVTEISPSRPSNDNHDDYLRLLADFQTGNSTDLPGEPVVLPPQRTHGTIKPLQFVNVSSLAPSSPAGHSSAPSGGSSSGGGSSGGSSCPSCLNDLTVTISQTGTDSVYEWYHCNTDDADPCTHSPEEKYPLIRVTASGYGTAGVPITLTGTAVYGEDYVLVSKDAAWTLSGTNVSGGVGTPLPVVSSGGTDILKVGGFLNLPGSGGSDVFAEFYVVPLNNADPSDGDRTVEFTIQEVFNTVTSSGGCTHPIYTVGNATAEVEIKDDDNWTVSASSVTNRDKALEPYSNTDVWGEFEIKRTDGFDTRYGINAVFALGGTADNKGLDYNLALVHRGKDAQGNDVETLGTAFEPLQVTDKDGNQHWGGSVLIPIGEESVRLRVLPKSDSIFEQDETVTLEVIDATNKTIHYRTGAGTGTVTILQAPEFISDTDKAVDVTKDNYTVPFAINGDTYRGFIVNDAKAGEKVNTVTEIFAAHNRGINYCFVLGNDVGQTLYRKSNGVWSLTSDNGNNVALFTIDSENGEIKTATDFALLKLPDMFSFTIKAYDKQYPQQYDTASVHISRFDLDVDTNRDLDVNNTDEKDEDKWTEERGAVILFNGDDDNGDHLQDNRDGVINQGNDIVDIGPLWLKKFGLPVPDDFRVELNLEQMEGEDPYWAKINVKERVRVFLPTNTGDNTIPRVGDEQLLGPSCDSYQATSKVVFRKGSNNPQANEYDISLFYGIGSVNFGIEGLIPGAPIKIVASFYLGKTLLGKDTVAAKVTPFIAFSHESNVDTNGKTVYVSEIMGTSAWNNDDLRDKLSQKYKSSLAVVSESTKADVPNSTKGDIWWQDPFEIGYVQSPYGSQHTILALPRAKARSEAMLTYAKDWMIRNGLGLYEKFADTSGEGPNDGGNFEVKPGRNSKGNSLGTIVMAEGPPAEKMPNGKIPSSKMRQDVVDFLNAQGVQDVIDNIDLKWMALGHIDEVVSFPTTAGGRARVASPEAAWALLLIAKKEGDASESIFDEMNRFRKTVGEMLLWKEMYDCNFVDDDNFSEKMLAVRKHLEYSSPVSVPSSNTLRRAGYLEVYDNESGGGTLEWKIEFTGSQTYNVFYRKEGTTAWTADGSGRRDEDFVSNSKICYILSTWWQNAVTAGQQITFTTQPSPDMIEMPVLFGTEYQHAFAFSNNVINSIVDGNTLFVSYVHGPNVNGVNLFNQYVVQAAEKVGFTEVLACEERVYHWGTGSIHCGTNVLRKISDSFWWTSFS